VTGSRMNGPGQWESWMATFDSPVFKFGEFLVFLAFAYHAVNGIRLVLAELGFTIGKAGRPIYPYVYSTMRQRPLSVALMIVTAVLMIIGGADFFLMAK
jgi:succinate dehydrogenase / fumarate reductase, cytochrome b subunit